MSVYTVYILYSQALDKFYKGQTSDLVTRLKFHLSGFERYSSRAKDWILIWSVQKDSRKAAIDLEKKLKHLNRERLIAFMLKYKNSISMDAQDVINRFE